jgi:hypothetical protein
MEAWEAARLSAAAVRTARSINELALDRWKSSVLVVVWRTSSTILSAPTVLVRTLSKGSPMTERWVCVLPLPPGPTEPPAMALYGTLPPAT